jgi:hypothetical protein
MTTAFRACGKARASVRYATPLSWMPDGGRIMMTTTTWESSGVVTVNSSPGRFSFRMVQSLLRLAGWMCVMALGRKTVLSDFFFAIRYVSHGGFGD